MLTREYIEAKSNIECIMRERGKIVGRRETHNIFPSIGQEWLAKLVCGETGSYINQMGPGIGGSKQNNSYVDAAPLNVYSPVGAYSQTDIDMSVVRLERPVMVTSAVYPSPPLSGTWLKNVATPTHPSPNSTRFVCVFTELELSFSIFSIVPLSELGLFTLDKNSAISSNVLVAYDTFAPIPKTTALELEIRWTITF